jgi:hypothetical protein
MVSLGMMFNATFFNYIVAVSFLLIITPFSVCQKGMQGTVVVVIVW